MESQLNEKWSHIKVYKQLTEARKTEAIMNGGLDIHILEDSVLVYTRYGTSVVIIKRHAHWNAFVIMSPT